MNRITGKRGAVLLAGIAVLALDGCATRRVAVAVAVPPPAPVAVAARPVLPADLPERLSVPVRDASGAYRTINYALTPEQAAWHVRSALNVAVLSCRGPGEAAIAADYNAMLKRQKAVLAAAYDRVQAQFRRTGGADWQAAQDAHSTRVYNFFALPPAKGAFCDAATAVLAESRDLDPAGFAAFAQRALPRLETPFTDVYRRYDAYRQELAAWQAWQPGATMAAGAGAPVVATVAATTRMATVSTPVPSRPATAAIGPSGPQLAYVGVDRLIDWQPDVPPPSERFAAMR